MFSKILPKERITSQKKVISEFLTKTKKHFTAEKIYLTVKKKLPQISRGTVYRILKNLKKQKKIQEILDERTSHFDKNALSHAHFICQKCHCIFDVFEEACRICPVVKNQKTKVGKINNYKINFYGYCKKCSKKL